jgi:hypothetical protein
VSFRKVAISADGTKLAGVEYAGDIWASTDSGATWTNQTTGTAASGLWWGNITSSADGAKLAATVYSGDIWTSDDSGATWTNQTTGTAASGFNWESITSSADGTKLAAIVQHGDIWTSDDSGVTWTNQTTGTAASGLQWGSITSSADGTKLVVTTYYGDIWTSTDSGTTWVNKTENTEASGQSWSDVASSADGTKLIAVATYGGMWTSIDSGDTWVQGVGTPTAGGLEVVGDSLWGFGNSNGLLRKSTDGGHTWDKVIPTGVTPPYGFVRSAVKGNTVVEIVQSVLYASTDGGVTWTEHPNQNVYDGWDTIQITNNGSTLIASSDNDCEYYASSDFGDNWQRLDGLDGAGDCDLLGISDDGQTILTGVQDGPLVVSTDGGLSSTQVAYPARGYWQPVSSGDGTLLTAYSWFDNTFWLRAATTSVATRPALTSSTSTQLRGEIINTGGEAAYERGFLWGTTSAYGNTVRQTGSFVNELFSTTLDSLSCGVTYYYKAFASNSLGTGYGADQTFSVCGASSGAGSGQPRTPVATTTATSTTPSTPTPQTQPTQTTRPTRTNPTTPTRGGNPLGTGRPSPDKATTATTTSDVATSTAATELFKARVALAVLKDLRYGDTGPGVKALQQLLNTLGFTLAESGAGSPGQETDYFGPRTLAAVKRFQKAFGLPQTGFFGPLSRAQMGSLMPTVKD